MNSDTVKLLKSCNVGCKYATDGMEQVLPFVRNPDLKKSIEASNMKHIGIGEAASMLLKESGKTEKEPAALTVLTSRIKRDIKLSFSSSPRTVASLMVNGCETGTKAICKALQNFPKADKESVELAKSIIKAEQEFLKEMIEYY